MKSSNLIGLLFFIIILFLLNKKALSTFIENEQSFQEMAAIEQKRITLDKNIVPCADPDEITKKWGKKGTWEDDTPPEMKEDENVFFVSKPDFPAVKSIGSTSALLKAIRVAYDNHLPLRISPDMFWITVVNSVGVHINKNAEKFRDIFVDHDGKKTLTAIYDPMVAINWQNMVDQLTGQIVGDSKSEFAKLVALPHFTTTNDVSITASKASLMSALQSYYAYRMEPMCGIPEIVMQGTLEDWQKLRDIVGQLANIPLELGRYFSRLDKIFAQFIRTYQGDVDVDFWSKIFSVNRYGSGSSHWNGWSTHFYIYDDDGKMINDGIDGGAVPNSYTTTPFEFIDTNGNSENRHLLSGMFSVGMYDDHSVGPIIQYAITKFYKRPSNRFF
jgi:hypothetical protein